MTSNNILPCNYMRSHTVNRECILTFLGVFEFHHLHFTASTRVSRVRMRFVAYSYLHNNTGGPHIKSEDECKPTRLSGARTGTDKCSQTAHNSKKMALLLYYSRCTTGCLKNFRILSAVPDPVKKDALWLDLHAKMRLL